MNKQDEKNRDEIMKILGVKTLFLIGMEDGCKGIRMSYGMNPLELIGMLGVARRRVEDCVLNENQDS